MPASIPDGSAAIPEKAVNAFLRKNGIRIADNPAISPDLTLDFPALLHRLEEAGADLRAALQRSADDPSAGRGAVDPLTLEIGALRLYPRSAFALHGRELVLVEEAESGDGALVFFAPQPSQGGGALPKGFESFRGFRAVPGFSDLFVLPLLFENLIALKNEVLDEDPGSALFPQATGSLERTSLGIGARFTTLHWPAVAFCMKALRLSLTANQNSIPRELVFDPDAMLEGRLSEVPFPFIGRSVPEGHQGQSVQGMSHAAVFAYLKYGFHRHRIPWGFNADHQPIGGRFDAVERDLVEGSLFASYITYDLSPELSAPRKQGETLEGILEAGMLPGIPSAAEVRRKAASGLRKLGLSLPEAELERILLFVAPAMVKMKKRDTLYTRLREDRFPKAPPEAKRFFKELSIDELPGETTPETLGVCLAFAEALGVRFQFVAPNIGFQKNFPFPDNAALREKTQRLFDVAEHFGISFGFHSGSGKSAENYAVLGEVTGGRLEIKTSGRYTYEMGRALHASSDAKDQALWLDWYRFTRELALEGAFAENPAQRDFARQFIKKALEEERSSVEAAAGAPADAALADPFRDRATLERILAGLAPSPDHMFFFEYNFLFVLAAGGSKDRLGDHGPEGYAQRRRFYSLSEEGRLRYAVNVARYILFLAEHTGIARVEDVRTAEAKLAGYRRLGDLLEEIGAPVEG